MADPIQQCDCLPYTVLNCCGPINGITIIQPTCQYLPDERVVNNPAYDSVSGKSYWSYKIMVSCDNSANKIDYFLIPVCSVISEDNMIVYEKVDGCGVFYPIDFELTPDDTNNFGPAPEGFQWLKIQTADRFEYGVCVEYCLEITGNFPTEKQPIKVNASFSLLSFDCDGGFLVPKCNPQGTLSLTKTCNYTIDNNRVTLNYDLTVGNIGNGPLENVQLNDIIIIPTQLEYGNVIVSPDTLNVDTLIPGEIIISGNLGTINPGTSQKITYTIPITSIEIPGVFIINSTAQVSASGTEAIATCPITLNVSQLSTAKCCNITGPNTGEFRITISSVGRSPSTVVDVVDNIFIPSGVTLRFTSYDGCTATYANTSELVPLNTDLTGPLRIRIDCQNLTIPTGGSIQKTIKFTVVSSSVFGEAAIKNTVESVTPVFPDQQIFLGAGAFPVEADVNVTLGLGCTKPCAIELDL